MCLEATFALIARLANMLPHQALGIASLVTLEDMVPLAKPRANALGIALPVDTHDPAMPQDLLRMTASLALAVKSPILPAPPPVWYAH